MENAESLSRHLSAARGSTWPRVTNAQACLCVTFSSSNTGRYSGGYVLNLTVGHMYANIGYIPW